MGRPSLVAERREQILEAFSRCLAERGLEGTTLDAVAAEAGVQRAALRHFVGNRDELIRAGVEYIAAQYSRSLSDDIQAAKGAERLDRILDSFFLGGFTTGHAQEDHALFVLEAAAASDDKIRESLFEMYRVFEEHLAKEIAAVYPDADPDRVRGVAYSIMCLTEQNSTMRWLGFPPARAQGARAAARTLVDTLPSR